MKLKVNDPIVTIESDKSSVEIPSIISGKIESISIKVGDKVSKGDVLLNITFKIHRKKMKKIIPKDTENLIKEAEQALKENEKTKAPSENKLLEKEKPANNSSC